MSAARVPLVSRLVVVTVSYGSDVVLPQFLAGLQSWIDLGLRVIVSDNDAVHGAEVHAIADSVGASYLPLTGNLGYGGAINAAVSELSDETEWVLVSNPDVRLEGEILKTLVETAEADDRIGSVGPAILTPEGTVYPSAREIPSIRNGIGHALFANLWPANPWTRAYKREGDALGARDAGWLSGACLLVRRSAFRAIGGFDTEYFMYFEDVDLGFRLSHAGYRNVYQPSVAVVHTGAHSTAEHPREMVAAHHESALRFLSKKYPGWSRWPVRAMLRIGLGMRSWLATRHVS